uniref:FLYWCH-type domain-containing protein n=1 Tax=Ditylenchus dipsaci TaxID=166011 RepID=A0A915DA72_9BILA
MNFELLTSEKNKPMLKDSDNCLYWKIIPRGKRTYWRCIHYRTGWDGTENTKCDGNLIFHFFGGNSSFTRRAVTFDGKCEINSAHNHYGDKNHAEVKRFQESFRSKHSLVRTLLEA